jgi:hypothetical protein
MVKAYLRYVYKSSVGQVTGNQSNIIYDTFSNH